MKGKAKITNYQPETTNINALAYNKVIEDIKKHPYRKKDNSFSNESADFETAISKAGYGRFNYFILLMAVPAACSSGFVTGSISLILPAAGCELQMTSFQKGLLNSAAYTGLVISAFFWGFLSDAFGRQRLLTYGFLLDSLMESAAALSPSFWVMFTFKFFSGIMVCGPYSIFMAYISEVFMNEKRDIAVLSAGIFSALGNIFQPALALFLMSSKITWSISESYTISSWRLFLIVCSIPSLVCGIGSAFCVESPKFLMEKGKQEEALKVFKRIYSINTGRPNASYPVIKLHDVRRPSAIARASTEEQKNFWSLLKNGVTQALTLLKPPFVTRAFCFFFIQFGSMAGLNIIRLWLPEMFTVVQNSKIGNNTMGDDQGICEIIMLSNSKPQTTCENVVITSEVFINMIYINCGTLLAHILFISVVKYVGKKFIINFSTLISASCIVVMPLLPTVYVVPLAAAFVALLNICFFAVIGTVVEVFPTKIRATSLSLTMMSGRLGVLFNNLLVASIMYTHCDLIFYGLFMLVAAVGISSLFLKTTPITDSIEISSTHKEGRMAH